MVWKCLRNHSFKRVQLLHLSTTFINVNIINRHCSFIWKRTKSIWSTTLICNDSTTNIWILYSVSNGSIHPVGPSTRPQVYAMVVLFWLPVSIQPGSFGWDQHVKVGYPHPSSCSVAATACSVHVTVDLKTRASVRCNPDGRPWEMSLQELAGLLIVPRLIVLFSWFFNFILVYTSAATATNRDRTKTTTVITANHFLAHLFLARLAFFSVCFCCCPEHCCSQRYYTVLIICLGGASLVDIVSSVFLYFIGL